jgi:5-(carboxyamino)imidazole ribonucleotide synthase
MSDPILPGATIGVFGSGQLGRMMALAARALGYHIHTFAPDAIGAPTAQVADHAVAAPYEDLDALRQFVRAVDVVTFEFENVSAAVAEAAEAEGVPVRPGGWVLHTAQHRLREKTFLARAGLPVAPFQAVHGPAEVETALVDTGLPAILKTAAFGYDGKGQVRIDSPDQIAAAWQALGGAPAILEAYVPFVCELSVVGARGIDGAFAHYGAIENIHARHILDLSVVPARIPAAVQVEAVRLTEAVLRELDVVGVLCVEFFLTDDDRLWINELAPRPHNSGHLTIDASITSQFEQQVRAVCGLPLGSTDVVRPAAMANLLGDLWIERAGRLNWPAALAIPGVKLHLYGKRDARPGRKMGHLTALADDGESALRAVQKARAALLTS